MTESQLAIAEAEALAARARLSNTLETLQVRLAPKNFARNAAKGAVDTSEKAARVGAQALKENPGKAAGVVAVIGLFLARNTIISAIRKRRG